VPISRGASPLDAIDARGAALHADGMLRATTAPPLEDGEAAPGNEAHDRAHDRTTPAELDQRARAALVGDPSALRDFLRAVAPLVRRVCRGVMSRDNPEVEDAIQDCLIDIARSLPHFRFEGSAAHYVTKIALRSAIASRDRARARAKHHAALEPSQLPVGSIDGAPGAHAELVRGLLDDLNDAQAQALIMRTMLGYSIEEIASMTGVSVNTVKTRLRLGKVQLRRWIGRSGEGRRGSR
jgi:RNA polymerase sigma-70 factor (ECF subfamily)